LYEELYENEEIMRLAVLLTSSLASAAGDVVASLESQYYAGLNFGAGWGGGFVVKPSVVFGYHYDQNSKFELEVLSNINNIASKDRVVGASLLANYRFYPDLDIDPVKLYVSGGLGGYLQIVPFGFGKKAEESVPPEEVKEGKNGKDDKPPEEVKENEEPEPEPSTEGGAISGTVPGIYGTELPGQSLADKILGSISYKLKVGVDYEITPQIVGAVGYRRRATGWFKSETDTRCNFRGRNSL
jgi:opacity protein-like surface antigen